ncbi:MAG: type II secretion system protein N [Gammaproteobacteria bacterium]|nr:type II secretion system protein N [Gammaproteobacteria bacterium]
MKRALSLGFLALIAYVLFLFVTFPAARAYQYIADQFPANIKLYGLKGSVWSGKAELITLASQQYSNASWHFQPKSLFVGEALFYLDLDNGQSQIKGSVGLNWSQSLILRDLVFQQELVDLQALAQTSAIVAGKISGRVENMVLSRTRITVASGKFVLRDTALLLPRRTEWGDFKLDISKPDSDVLMKLSDQGGPLLANGTVVVDENNAYQVDLAVQAASGASNDLIQGVDLFGRPGNDGKVHLKYNGSLSELLGVKSNGGSINSDNPA